MNFREVLSRIDAPTLASEIERIKGDIPSALKEASSLLATQFQPLRGFIGMTALRYGQEAVLGALLSFVILKRLHETQGGVWFKNIASLSIEFSRLQTEFFYYKPEEYVKTTMGFVNEHAPELIPALVSLGTSLSQSFVNGAIAFLEFLRRAENPPSMYSLVVNKKVPGVNCTLEEVLGEFVVIVKEHKDYDGILRTVGTRARVYLGETFGVLTPDEEPLIFDNQLPFIGTKRTYFGKFG